MKQFLTKTFLLCFLLFNSLLSLSQNYYEDSYNELKDEIFYPFIDKTLGGDSYDTLMSVGTEAFEYYFHKGETERGIYLFNVCMYYPTGSGYSDLTIPMLKEKIKFLRSENDTLNVHFATMQHILAFGLKLYDEYEKAEPLLKNAIRIYELKEAKLLHTCSAYQSLGGLYIAFNDQWKTYTYSQKALRGYESVIVDDEQFKLNVLHDMAFIYLNLALSMEKTKQEELSYAFNQKAFDIYKENFPQIVNTVVAAINLSANCIRLENYDESLKFLNIADTSFKNNQNMDWYYMVYEYIPKQYGETFLKSGNPEAALSQFRNLLSHYQKYYPENPEKLHFPYLSIGNCFSELGNFDSAMFYFSKAEETASGNPETAKSISMLYAKQNKFEVAIKALENSLLKQFKLEKPARLYADLFSDKYDGYDFCKLLSDFYLKEYFESKNRILLESSLKYAHIADTLIRSYRDITLIGANDIKMAKDYKELSNIAVQAAYLLSKDFEQMNAKQDMLKFVSNSNAFKLNAQVYQTGLKESADSRQIDLLLKIRLLENKLMALQNSSVTDEKRKLKKELFEARLDAFELSYELQLNNVKQKDDLFFKDMDIAEIQSKLNKNEAICLYHFTETMLYAMFLDAKEVQIFELGNKVDVENSIRQYFKSIKTFSKNLNRVSNELYAVLIEPFEKGLKTREKLIIIQDGMLSQIPFEVLTDSKGEYLIEKLSLVYNYSFYLWLKSRSTAPFEEYSFLGFAPVFSDEELQENNPVSYDRNFRDENPDILDGNKLKPLPFSQLEVETIKDLFGENEDIAKIFIRNAANESNLKRVAKNYNILHIATHGYSSKSDPEFSGLFMHAEEESSNVTNDGFLYLGEIYTLITKANLVVLSACKTGTGVIQEGEGVMALPRAFIFAGVPNLMVSLWKIHDEKTKNLMIDFYKELLSGRTYAEALRQAKLEMIKEGENPLDWSGIVLIGG
jgi:CHAT domain-containing protein/tetratricopeptide (TPR) repeat protein